jgi:hypothetical protein
VAEDTSLRSSAYEVLGAAYAVQGATVLAINALARFVIASSAIFSPLSDADGGGDRRQTALSPAACFLLAAQLLRCGQQRRAAAALGEVARVLPPAHPLHDRATAVLSTWVWMC